MNLRLASDSIRLRLSREECDRLLEQGELWDALSIGAGALRFGARLRGQPPLIEVAFQGDTLELSVLAPPLLEARRRAPAKDAGVYHRQGSLELAIEVDAHQGGRRAK